jgi:CRP-like cAMP-binding protein
MLRLLALPDAESRVRAVLAHISSIYGIHDTRGVMIPFKLTHKEIADFTALTRETVSRLLARFIKSGEIELNGTKSIVLKSSFFNLNVPRAHPDSYPAPMQSGKVRGMRP